MTLARARAALVSVALMTVASIASADPPAKPAASVPGDAAKKEAQALFSQALKQAESGDQRAALTSFRAAYDKYPSFRVLYNIGQLCARLGDGACSVRAYEQYLRDGGADVPAKRRTEVEAEVTALSRTVATLTITSNVAGAEVFIDDTLVGRTPLAAPIPVNAGAHAVVLVNDGKKIERSFNAVSGDAATLDIQVPKVEPVVTVVEKEAPERPAAPPPRRPFPVVPWAVTGGFAVATAVTGILAASAYSSFKDKRDDFPITREELDDAQGSARNLLLLTGLFGTVTVVSAGVAGYFTFLAPGPAAPRVGLAVSPRGVLLQGTLP